MTGEEEEMTEDTHQDQEAVLDLTKGGQCTTGEVVAWAEEILALVLHPTEKAVHHLAKGVVAHHPTEVIAPHLIGAEAHQISSATEVAAPGAVIDSL